MKGRDVSLALCLVLIMIVGTTAPVLATGVAGAATVGGSADGAATPAASQSSAHQSDLQDTTQEELNESEKREAARDGVDKGVELAQMQGVNVTQEQIQAARDGALTAANQSQAVNVSQIQSATAGATHAALVQSQNVTVNQTQAAVAGATNGSLTQSQNASVSQLQSAAYGAVHGTLAQKQNVSVEQVQSVSNGSAAGAAKSAAEHDVKTAPVIQEAAQGSAYGAITQTQNVTVEQRQAAAFGAAFGVLESNQTVSIVQRQSVDYKKVQAVAISAAKGGLTQSQEATVEQIQSACRGAAKGAISQSQNVTVTQLQAAAEGAAEGGISQHQVATVTQIQAASTGAAKGALTQKQSVNIVQIQRAATGGAEGAARGAAQNQVVNIKQIQAAAAGASQGGIVQIQIVNVIQIQIISGAAAEGAISQHQTANVVQIQNAARGASTGGVSQSQTQRVSVTQIQRVVLDAASTSAETAARENETEGEEVAKSAQQDVEREVSPTPEDIESLNVTTDCESITIENPNDQSVTVTRVGEDGGVTEVTVGAGESESIDAAPQSYALHAETDDGTRVQLDDLLTLVVVIDACPPEEPEEPEEPEDVEIESLTVTVIEQNVTIENTNNVSVNVTVENATGVVFEREVQADSTVILSNLSAGEYTISAERDGQTVQVEQQQTYIVEIPEAADEEPDAVELESLNVTVEEQNLTIENTNNVSVNVTVENATGVVFEAEIEADGTETVSDLAAGEYDVSAERDDESVPVENQSVYTVTISEVVEEEPDAVELESLNVTVEEQNLTVENPNNVSVNVTVENETGIVFEGDVPADGSATLSDLAAGEYEISAEHDGESVPVENQSVHTVTIAEVVEEEPDAVELESLNATVEEQNLTIENTNNVSVNVTVENETGVVFESEVQADGTETVSDLAPGEYDVSAERAGETVPVENQSVYTVTIPEAEDEGVDTELTECTVIDEPGEYNLTSDLDVDQSDTCLDVQTSNVSIEGQGNAITAVGDAPDSTAVSLGGDAVVLSNVSLSNVTIEGFGTGVTLVDVEEGELRNVSVNASDTGVSFDFATDVVVANSTIRGEEDAETTGLSGIAPTNVTITGTNVSEMSRSGISLADTVSVTVDNNNVSDSAVGISITQIQEERVAETDVPGADTGQGVAGLDGNLVANNRIENITEAAVSVQELSVGNQFVDNTLVNVSTGFETVESTNNVVEGGSIDDAETAVSLFPSEGISANESALALGDLTVANTTTVVNARGDAWTEATGVDIGPVSDVGWNATGVRVAGSEGVTGQVPGTGDLPALPDGVSPIVSDGNASFVGVTGTSEDAQMELRISYDETALPDERNESELGMWATNESAPEGWSVAPDSSVDTEENVVNATFEPPQDTERVYGPAAGAVEADEPELDSLQVETDVCAAPAEDETQTRQANVSVLNPNDQNVSLVGSLEGVWQDTVTVAPGENVVELPPEAGNWTFQAYVPAEVAQETDFSQPGPYPDLTQVAINGQESITFEVELCTIDLSVSETDGNVTVTNDAPIDATVFVDDGATLTETVPAGESVVLDSLEAGEYTLTAEASDGGPATLNGQAELTVTIEAAATPTPTDTPEATPTPTDTPAATPTDTPAPTPTPTDTPADTPTDETPTPEPPENETETAAVPTIWHAAADVLDSLLGSLWSGFHGGAALVGDAVEILTPDGQLVSYETVITGFVR